MPTRVRSHCKINLGLFLGAPRADGFHSLVTVYQTLELHDIVTVTARPAETKAIRITSNDERVPTDSRNTAWKMIAMALECLELKADVSIHIEKKLPVQGGLGAGSANAAAVFVGLELELEAATPQGPQIMEAARERAGRLALDSNGRQSWPARLQELAGQVGSDVPLFLIGGTVRGKNRGEDVYPLPDIEPTWCVIVVPEICVSTPQAFRDWDALCEADGLTPEASAVRLEKSSRAYAAAFSGNPGRAGRADSSGVFPLGEDRAGPQETTHESGLVRTGITSWIENDFERVVFPQHPSLAEIKHLLAAAGTPEAALFASLSGSGSALFGLYLTRGDAEAAKQRVESQVPGVIAHITRTLPRKEYWEQMILKDSF